VVQQPITEPVRVVGDGLLLRPFTVDDVSQVESESADPLFIRWNGLKGQTAEEFCLRRADWSDGTHASWAVADPDAEQIVLGSMSLYSINLDQSDCEVGFWVTAAHRGKGVATRALRVATRFAFDQVGVRRVNLFHAVANVGSCRVAEACGYLLEGVHRQSHRYGDGVWHDEHCHARLASD
jgi:RimJ/RimL family protein N-acetyltransferase